MTALISGCVALVLRRRSPSRVRTALLPAAIELALLSSLYSIWRLARVLPLDQPEGAIGRARQIVRL